MLTGDMAIVSALRHGVMPDGVNIVRANGLRDKIGRWRRNRYLCDVDTGRTRGVIFSDGSGNIGGQELDFKVPKVLSAAVPA